jgi:hypothetical protein
LGAVAAFAIREPDPMDKVLSIVRAVSKAESIVFVRSLGAAMQRRGISEELVLQALHEGLVNKVESDRDGSPKLTPHWDNDSKPLWVTLVVDTENSKVLIINVMWGVRTRGRVDNI